MVSAYPDVPACLELLISISIFVALYNALGIGLNLKFTIGKLLHDSFSSQALNSYFSNELVFFKKRKPKHKNVSLDSEVLIVNREGYAMVD